MIEALRAFGAPLGDLTEDDLSTPGVVFQIGVEPIRIDVLTAIHGVDFDEAWADRLMLKFADQGVCVLSKEHLIKNKLAAARSKTWSMSERSNATGKNFKISARDISRPTGDCRWLRRTATKCKLSLVSRQQSRSD